MLIANLTLPSVGNGPSPSLKVTWPTRGSISVDMNWRFGACLAAAFAVAPDAVGQLADAELSVERSTAASDCPDASEVRRLVEKLVRNAVDGRVEVRISMDRFADVYTAEMRASGAREGVRKLRVRGPDCTGLTETLTASLALLLDPNADLTASEPDDGGGPSGAADSPGSDSTAHSPEVPPAVPAQHSALPTGPTRPSSGPEGIPSFGGSPKSHANGTDSGTSLRGELAIGPRLILGLLPNIAVGPHGMIHARAGSFAAGLGGGWFVPQRASFYSGKLRNEAASFEAGICALNSSGESWAFGGCAEALVTWIRVRGEGFDVNRVASEALWYTGVGGRLQGPLAHPFGFELSADALLPLGERAFTVDNIGRVWSTSALAGAARLSVRMSIW